MISTLQIAKHASKIAVTGVFRFARNQRSSAVSYTHLRAHETVLDLVCRLLLEKHKNYAKTTTNYTTNIHRTDKNIDTKHIKANTLTIIPQLQL